jgi:hypothetical protein
MVLEARWLGRTDWPALATATTPCYMDAIHQVRHDPIKRMVVGAYPAQLVGYCPNACLSSSGLGVALGARRLSGK